MEANGIEDAGAGFDDARFRVALARRQGHAFGDKRPECRGSGRGIRKARQVIRAAGSAGGGQERAAQPQLADGCFELSFFHTMSFASKIGPSLQTRT